MYWSRYVKKLPKTKPSKSVTDLRKIWSHCLVLAKRWNLTNQICENDVRIVAVDLKTGAKVSAKQE